MVQFTVHGDPVAQGRPRFTSRHGFAQTYDPARSKDYKHYVKLVASMHMPEKPMEGPLCLIVDVYRGIPKSFSKKKQEDAEIGLLRPTTKPDADNYLKGIKDALKGIIWLDDNQVVDVRVRKWYSESPRIEVKCYPVGEELSA